MRTKSRAALVKSIIGQHRKAAAARDNLFDVRDSTTSYLYHLNLEHRAKGRKETLVKYAQKKAPKDPKLSALLSKLKIT